MAKMIESMEQLLRGDAPQPPAARLIGMALESFGSGEAVVVLPRSSCLALGHCGRRGRPARGERRSY